MALCTGGQHLAVEFEGKQGEGPDSTNRQTPQNFADTAGSVFRVVGGGALVPLKRSLESARCSRAIYPAMEMDKKRPVVGCWPIAESSGGTQIVVIELSRFLTQALACLVINDGERRLYVDYPATFTGPGDDLWRADDGGNIHANGFEIVFLLRRGDTYVLGVDWAASEGSALSLQVSQGGAAFTEVIGDSWYRSPP